MADILAFPGNPGAPIQPAPFGRRPKLEGLQDCLETVRDALRPGDRAQVDRIKRAAREARNAFDKRHIDPSLSVALASRWEMLATMAHQLAAECKALGHLKHAVSARELAGIMETIATEIEADLYG